MEGTGYLDEQLNLRHERFHRIDTRRRTVVGLEVGAHKGPLLRRVGKAAVVRVAVLGAARPLVEVVGDVERAVVVPAVLKVDQVDLARGLMDQNVC